MHPTYSVIFKDVDGLSVGSPVKLMGKHVGNIIKLELLDSEIYVTFRITEENTIIPNYVNQAINNKKIEVWGKGNRLQNYIHVSDVCNLIKQIIFKFNVVKGEILLAVNSKEYSNIYLAQLISEFTNSKIIFVNEDKSKSNFFDSTKTNNQL